MLWKTTIRSIRKMEKTNKTAIVVRCFIALLIMFVAGKLLGTYISGLLEGRLPEAVLMFIKGSSCLYTVGLAAFYLIIKGIKPVKLPAPSMTLTVPRFIKIFLVQSGLSFIAMLPINVIIKLSGIKTNTTTPEEILAHPVFYIFMLIFFAPIMEELVFRKLMLSRLLKIGTVPAVIVSAAFFALPHLYSQGPAQVPYTFVLGLVWAYVYIRTGKLLPAIVLHSFSNIYCGFLTVFWPLDTPLGMMAYAFTYVMCMPCIAILITVFSRDEIKRIRGV